MHMLKATKAHHGICLLGIIIFAWLYYTLPGIYYGHLNGFITIVPPDNSEMYYFSHIHVNSETQPTWEWTKPDHFRYNHLDLTINDKNDVIILFPALTCTYETKEDVFTKEVNDDDRR